MFQPTLIFPQLFQCISLHFAAVKLLSASSCYRQNLIPSLFNIALNLYSFMTKISIPSASDFQTYSLRKNTSIIFSQYILAIIKYTEYLFQMIYC